jgi:hypothetical protein
LVRRAEAPRADKLNTLVRSLRLPTRASFSRLLLCTRPVFIYPRENTRQTGADLRFCYRL